MIYFFYTPSQKQLFSQKIDNIKSQVHSTKQLILGVLEFHTKGRLRFYNLFTSQESKAFLLDAVVNLDQVSLNVKKFASKLKNNQDGETILIFLGEAHQITIWNYESGVKILVVSLNFISTRTKFNCVIIESESERSNPKGNFEILGFSDYNMILWEFRDGKSLKEPIPLVKNFYFTKTSSCIDVLEIKSEKKKYLVVAGVSKNAGHSIIISMLSEK